MLLSIIRLRSATANVAVGSIALWLGWLGVQFHRYGHPALEEVSKRFVETTALAAVFGHQQWLALQAFWALTESLLRLLAPAVIDFAGLLWAVWRTLPRHVQIGGAIISFGIYLLVKKRWARQIAFLPCAALLWCLSTYVPDYVLLQYGLPCLSRWLPFLESTRAFGSRSHHSYAQWLGYWALAPLTIYAAGFFGDKMADKLSQLPAEKIAGLATTWPLNGSPNITAAVGKAFGAHGVKVGESPTTMLTVTSSGGALSANTINPNNHGPPLLRCLRPLLLFFCYLVYWHGSDLVFDITSKLVSLITETIMHLRWFETAKEAVTVMVSPIAKIINKAVGGEGEGARLGLMTRVLSFTKGTLVLGLVGGGLALLATYRLLSWMSKVVVWGWFLYEASSGVTTRNSEVQRKKLA